MDVYVYFCWKCFFINFLDETTVGVPVATDPCTSSLPVGNRQCLAVDTGKIFWKCKIHVSIVLCKKTHVHVRAGYRM